MFARAVFSKAKPGCEANFTRTPDQEVIPLLRREKGFRGLIAFIVSIGTEALSLSLWDKEENARASCAASFKVLMALVKVVLGDPIVQAYEVTNSTLHTMEEMIGQGKVVEASPGLQVCRVPDPAFQTVLCGARWAEFSRSCGAS